MALWNQLPFQPQVKPRIVSDEFLQMLVERRPERFHGTEPVLQSIFWNIETYVRQRGRNQVVVPESEQVGSSLPQLSHVAVRGVLGDVCGASEILELRATGPSLGIQARSMHSPRAAFEADGREKAVELNSIVGSTSVVMASAGGRFETVDEWKRVAELLTQSQEVFERSGIRAGYHNHQFEWRPLEGKRRAMDVLAADTPHSVTLQLDVGTCVEMGVDPVAWINANPGRIRNIHCKDWTPGSHEDGKAYRVLFGEGKSPWREIFAAAESVGGVEFYLIEQEGSRYSELETAQRCLDTYRKMRA